MTGPHIAVLCATQRGVRFVERLAELAPGAALTVFSFREEAHEPPFLDDLKSLTEACGGRFYEARQVGAAKWEGFWRDTPPDLLFMVSWRYLVPRAVYQQARLGAFALHDSLLPAYRGFAPTVWAIINGEEHTGVTLFEVAEGVDTGPIVAQRGVPIYPDDTIADVLSRVTESYLDVLEEQLPALLAGNAPRTVQDVREATFTCRRLPEDNRIDWSRPAAEIYNLIRAVTAPYPGAFTTFSGRRLSVWTAQPLAGYSPYVGRVPGRVVEVRSGEGSVVLTGDGALLLTNVQFEGEPRRNASEVLTSLSHTLGR
ncbi:MAG: methionyl-tRNA formyltransferase-like protein [Anaerolineae bacterium]|nr:methionyl-tRNA formyltransferase-like protein [Anaerolineae bacterium]